MGADSGTYQRVKSIADLPDVPASMVDISVQSEQEAQEYALRTGRRVYWIDDLCIGVWYELFPAQDQTEGEGTE